MAETQEVLNLKFKRTIVQLDERCNSLEDWISRVEGKVREAQSELDYLRGRVTELERNKADDYHSHDYADSRHDHSYDYAPASHSHDGGWR